MSFGETWAYSDNINWKKDYPAAIGSKQSPINIDKKNALMCDILCEIALSYSKSNCILTVKNRTPIIYFSSGSYIKHVATEDILSLKAMTIHTPSLHTINGVKYDMEVVLYHKIGGGLNPKSQNYTPGGTAVSILFEKGVEHGRQNIFFNSFVYKIPNDIDSVKNNIDVDVGKEWGAEMILPELKSYYYYEGSLPFPPCEENWRWIVFEEIQPISEHILSVLSLGFNGNVRPLRNLGTRKISYNSNIDLPSDKKLNEKSEKTNVIDNVDVNYESEEYSTLVKDSKNNMVNKTVVKIIFTILLIILVIYASLKMAKFIISKDILNQILAPGKYASARRTITSASNKA